MAIEINGSSNTITGIAVGGLPNGIVDNDMIANSTIAEAKLAASVNTIKMTDTWRVNTNFSFGNAVTFITANWEKADTDGSGFVGSGMTESSGIFTFPETGIYLIQFQTIQTNSAGAANLNCYIHTTLDNGTSYSDASLSLGRNISANTYINTYQSFTFDVTDTSTHKCKFAVYASGANGLLNGQTARNGSAVFFTRLGDT